MDNETITTSDEIIRNKDHDGLTDNEKIMLSYYLMHKVDMDVLTPKDKKFLNTPMEEICTYCERKYEIPPAISNGQCQTCMSEQGLRYEENMLTPGSNLLGKVALWGFAALIVWGWLSL